MRLFAVALLACVIVAAVVVPATKASAFSPNYDPNNIIDNPTLLNSTTMSAAAIQMFLDNLGGGIARYSDVEACDASIAAYYPRCGQTLSAAQLIYDASQAYGINPRAILATMQKEESLVTDPTPSSFQINCAMGYNSCTDYVGFFTQIDNGTWIIRYNYEGASKHATWLRWFPGANYPCATAKDDFYNNGLFPGNIVTFANSGGVAKTVTLSNAATASFYCYTPYVGPYSVTGYSGSYNFVYYFQLWFGSTQASSPYAWNYENQFAYSDAARTKPLTGTPTVAPGGLVYARLKVRNVGYQAWSQSTLHLGTSRPNDRTSQLYDSSWLGGSRAAGMVEASVAPGEEGTFNFILHAPSQVGVYKEYFNLVQEGVTWLNDPGLFYQINVVTPVAVTNTSNTTMTPGQTFTPGNNYLLSGDTQNVLSFQKDGNLVLYDNYKAVWSSGTGGTGASSLIMQSDGNLVIYDKNMRALWNTATNSPGASLYLQSDGNLVLYSTNMQPLWSTSTLTNPDNLSYVNTTLPQSFMFPGQSLNTADRRYRLILQTDGNLVLYNNTMKPIWSTGTNGIPVRYLALQGDGNLVLYSFDNRPIWNSVTPGNSGSNLTIQQDGNLVLYSPASVPLWHSQTNGK